MPWKGLCHSCSNSQPNFELSRFEEKGGRCWEKCGIGGKLTINDVPDGLSGYKACDDGNLINGDGCSASCSVEKNFNCVGGAENKVDFCYTLVKPVAEIIPINNSTKFQVVFSKKVAFRNPVDKNAKVDRPMWIDIQNVVNDSYKVEWKYPSGDEIEYANFTITPNESLVNVKVTVFFDRVNIVDKFDNSLMNVKIRTNTTIIIDKRFPLEKLFKTMKVINEVNTIVVPVSSLGITNYILQNFIRYMTTFQILGSGIFYNVR